ncbi:class I SAM-dependent methyltransferase [Roseateles sp. BYS87W]|uniref:Class I SAM-dependent methyltransferase n=1 Tax=Pelomonas baiyunensis TaxID=3299026 RepID=A0ABW7GWX2_9BURK
MNPSDWLQRWAPHVAGGPGTALDVACGGGRNLRWLAQAGWRVTGVDRDEAAIAPLASLARIVQADIESAPWPLPGESFDLVLVCNYLWRPCLEAIRASVKPSGWLIWETFADGQQHIGRPRRPEFLLQRGELLRVFNDWHIVAYEDVFESGVNPRYVQRVAAVKPPAA